jgi:predicted ATP-dependent endonuclease of OLD family
MFIEWIKLTGFRNFKDAQINLRKKSLVIGSNDVGKTVTLKFLRRNNYSYCAATMTIWGTPLWS